MSHDIYEELMDKYSTFPFGAPPKGDLFRTLVETLFTPEEATLAIRLPIFPTEINELAGQMGIPIETLQPQLEALCNKALVDNKRFGDVNCYSLMPLAPSGIFELSFMKGETSPEMLQKAKLFEQFYTSGWADQLFELPTKGIRVLCVEKEIPSEKEIFPYQRVADYIRNSPVIGLSFCYCRHQYDLLGKACNAPRETCMSFGIFADFVVERGFGRNVTVDEALKVLDRTEEHGLVHMTENAMEGNTFMCHCCGCCCVALRGITQLHKDAVNPSEYVAEFDPERCNNCGLCEDRCQVHAITIQDEKASSSPERCVGCGLCVSACPEGAIRLVSRPAVKHPMKTLMDLHGQILGEALSK
jgi:ferredoxin